MEMQIFNEIVSLACMAFGRVEILRYHPNLMFCIVHDLRSIHHIGVFLFTREVFTGKCMKCYLRIS